MPVPRPEQVPRVLAVVATPVGMRVLVARFFRHMISENVQVFWAALQGVSSSPMRPRRLGRIASRARGGWSPVAGCARGGAGTCRGVTCLSLSGRRSRWPGPRVSRCGRSPRGWGAPRRRSHGSWAATLNPSGRYRATSAHASAWERAARPKPAKLATNLAFAGQG